MKKIELNDIKKIEIEVLDEFHHFCEQNNLKYSLGFGTLLGAIRHEGFIPWDDDIDIIMPIEDYEKFISIYKSESNKYVLLTPGDKTSCFTYAKLYDKTTYKKEPRKEKYNHGIDIDIFPIKYMYDDDSRNKKVIKKASFLEVLLALKVRKYEFNSLKDILKNILTFLCNLIPLSIIKKIIINACKAKSTSKYMGVYIGAIYNDKNKYRQVFKKEIFNKYKMLKFEGKYYYCVENYHELLKKTYGNDYMELPPISERITHHVNETYILNEIQK